MKHTTTPDEAGTATLELALTLPLILLVIWGAVTYGLVFTVDHALNAAAAEGARAAVGTATEAEAVTAATAAASGQLTALGSSGANAVVDTPTVTDCPSPTGTRCITVRVSYPWATAPVVPDLLQVVTPDLLTAESTVQLTDWGTS